MKLCVRRKLAERVLPGFQPGDEFGAVESGGEDNFIKTPPPAARRLVPDRNPIAGLRE